MCVYSALAGRDLGDDVLTFETNKRKESSAYELRDTVPVIFSQSLPPINHSKRSFLSKHFQLAFSSACLAALVTFLKAE